MDRRMFRKIVNWVGILILIHIISWMIFGFFISREILIAYADEEFGLARVIIFSFELVIMTVASLFYSYTVTSSTDYKNNLKKTLKMDNFSIIAYFKSNFLKELLIKTGVYSIFQIPYTVLFAIRGLVLQNRTGFDGFYSLDIGAYAMTGSAIFGLILNTLIFGVIFILSNFVGLYLTKRSLESVL